MEKALMHKEKNFQHEAPKDEHEGKTYNSMINSSDKLMEGQIKVNINRMTGNHHHDYAIKI